MRNLTTTLLYQIISILPTFVRKDAVKIIKKSHFITFQSEF